MQKSIVLFGILAGLDLCHAQDIRPLRSLSGASGKVVGAQAVAGGLTAPMAPMLSLQYGGTTRFLPKNPQLPVDSTSEFSRRDTIYIYTYWLKKDKAGKGEIGAKVYDAENRMIVNVAPKRISLPNESTRFGFGFSPSTLAQGIYRVDFTWDNKPAWRTFVQIVD